MRLWGIVLALVLSSSAFAKTPVGQGRACSHPHPCERGQQCITARDGKQVCEISCNGDRGCPEDQRCVLDNEQKLCRATVDL